MHLRIALHEAPDHRRQRVARLGVGGGDGERAHRLAPELVAQLLEVAGVGEDALGDRQDVTPRLGQAREALAAAHEDLYSELVLELEDLAAQARLRGVQGLCSLRQVELVAGHFADRAQLLELHGARIRPRLAGVCLGVHALVLGEVTPASQGE